MEVYINDVAAYLPNDPVDNDHIEEIVGRIHSLPSRIKRRILNNNKIEQRYYAIDRTTGALTHTNAQLTAEAIRRLNPSPGFTPDDDPVPLLRHDHAGPDRPRPRPDGAWRTRDSPLRSHLHRRDLPLGDHRP